MTKTSFKDNLQSALLMFRRAHTPFTEHEGNIDDICKKIISLCDNGTYFMVSAGHFQQFYTRDFGMCVKSLIKLGFEKRVHTSIEYALVKFMHAKKITTTIDHRGICIDFFAPAADSLPFLLHAIHISNYSLNQAEIEFIEDQIALYYAYFWNNQQNCVTRHKYISSARDHYIRDASCYDFCMVGWTKNLCQKLNLFNPFKEEVDFEKLLLENYWSGDYFYDDLTITEQQNQQQKQNKQNQTNTQSNSIITSDAQIFPFYTGICQDKTKYNQAFNTIYKQELNQPFPVQYAKVREKYKERFESFLAPNYEGNTIWIHVGLCYLEVLENYDIAQLKIELQKYTTLVEIHKNMLEVFYKNGKPYKTLLYKADENLLWISIYYRLYLTHLKL
jgi:hypothetical protein